MRNLKRALSLGLTAAMISGLMVMGSSAASYADVTSEDNQEAIEVLQAVEIMVGDENGDFNPDQNVTRNEMAVIMSNLMEYNVASYKDTSPFTDVPSWAEPYVAACWTNGITAGTSATTYGGSDTVTTAQAALMLMKALGYFQYASDFGSDWQLATTRQGNAIDLFVGVDSGVEQAMTRNDVAQLVLNTLEAGTVEASTDGSWTIGDVTINNNVTYNYITSNQAYATAIDDARSTSNNSDAQRSIVELGEQLYMGDLQLNDNTTDVFGRPARTWEYNSSEIGTYVQKNLLRQEFTTAVTGRELYDVLGSNVLDHYDVDIYFDGETDEAVVSADNYFDIGDINRNNRADLNSTGDGVLTQVYVDNNNEKAVVAIINTYLAKSTDDYDDRSETLDLDVYGIDEYSNTGAYFKELTTGAEDVEDFDVEGEDFDIADVLEGEFFLVTVADGAIQTMEPAEVMAGATVSGFSLGDYVTVDGTDINYADTAEYKHGDLDAYDDLNLKDVTYNIYLDNYGYLIGIELVEKVNNYVFITGIDNNASNLGTRQADANAIFLDGTMDTIKVDLTRGEPGTLVETTNNKATINSWFTYTVNNAGVYTLTEVGNGSDDIGQVQYNGADYTTTVEINDEHYSMPANANDSDDNRIYADDESTYILGEVLFIDNFNGKDSIIINDVDTVVVGIENVNMETYSASYVNSHYGPISDPGAGYENVSYGIYALYDEEARIIGAVVVGEDNGISKNLVYVHTGNMNREEDMGDRDYLWTREVIFEGKEIEIQELADSPEWIGNKTAHQGVVTGTGTWYEVSYDADGYVRKMEPVADALGGVYNSATNDDGGYVTNITDVEPAIQDGNDTILYQQPLSTKPNLGSNNRTLYINTIDTNGLRVHTDVNIVLIQQNNNKWSEVYETGRDQLDDIIDDLHNNGGYNYNLSAVIEDGYATTIIFYDNNSDGYAPTVDSGEINNAAISKSGEKLCVTWTDDNSYVGKNVEVKFYLLDENGKSFLKDTVSDTMLSGTSHSVTSDAEINQNGDYYAVITIYDSGKAVATATTSAESLAF